MRLSEFFDIFLFFAFMGISFVYPDYFGNGDYDIGLVPILGTIYFINKIIIVLKVCEEGKVPETMGLAINGTVLSVGAYLLMVIATTFFPGRMLFKVLGAVGAGMIVKIGHPMLRFMGFRGACEAL